MKTAAEWADVQPCDIGTRKDWLRWISAIQSDARAGMVPEAELADARASYDASHAANTKLHDALVAAVAELAKAWCDGRDAAWRAMATCNDKTHAEELRAISKLQPPGGKAK